MSKIILDLCGGTGSWSKPYKEVGYDVKLITTPDYDVRKYEPPDNVYGVLAAPPCTMFSMARTTAKTPRDLKQGMEIVEACLRIIWQCQYEGNKLKFWALENPLARLRWFLGEPTMVFCPSEYGHRYFKPTALWGNFNKNLKQNKVKLTRLEKLKMKKNNRPLPAIPEGYTIPDDMNLISVKRSITPSGFAEAFMCANK